MMPLRVLLLPFLEMSSGTQKRVRETVRWRPISQRAYSISRKNVNIETQHFHLTGEPNFNREKYLLILCAQITTLTVVRRNLAGTHSEKAHFTRLKQSSVNILCHCPHCTLLMSAALPFFSTWPWTLWGQAPCLTHLIPVPIQWPAQGRHPRNVY